MICSTWQFILLFLFTLTICASTITNECVVTLPVNDTLQNVTLLPNVPYEMAYLNGTTLGNYCKEYVVEMDIAVEQIPRDDWPTIEGRLEGILVAAFVQSTRAHLRQNTQGILNFESNNTVQNIKTKVLGTKFEGGLTKLSFVEFFDNQLVASDVVTKDISLMTYSHISAALQLPVINLIGQHQIEKNKLFRWWLVGVIVGSGILIITLGWCCLFCYYNTCGKPITIYETNKMPTLSKPYEIESEKKNPIPNIIVTQSSPGPHKPNERDLNPDHPKSKNVSTTRFEIRKQKKLSRQQHKKHRYTAAPRWMPYSLTRSLVVHDTAFQELKLPTDTEKAQFNHSDVHSQNSKMLHNDASLNSILVDTETKHPEELIDMKRWSPYMPGDFVAATYSIGANIVHHPSPGVSTENGVIELIISP